MQNVTVIRPVMPVPTVQHANIALPGELVGSVINGNALQPPRVRKHLQHPGLPRFNVKPPQKKAVAVPEIPAPVAIVGSMVAKTASAGDFFGVSFLYKAI